jgi:hypothetical protein
MRYPWSQLAAPLPGEDLRRRRHPGSPKSNRCYRNGISAVILVTPVADCVSTAVTDESMVGQTLQGGHSGLLQKSAEAAGVMSGWLSKKKPSAAW